MPDAGPITAMHLPTGDNVRIDTALCDDYTVGLDYEPLMAKIMAWGEDREQAIRSLQRALLEFRIEGVKCNVPLLRDILASKEFGGGSYHTGSVPGWVERLQSHIHHGPPNGHTPRNDHVAETGVGDDTTEKEIAAAIGVAMALAMNQVPSTPSVNSWRVKDAANSSYPALRGTRVGGN